MKYSRLTQNSILDMVVGMMEVWTSNAHKSVEILPAIPGADLLGRLLAFDPTRRLSVVGSLKNLLS